MTNKNDDSDLPLESVVQRVSESPLTDDRKEFSFSDLSLKTKVALGCLLIALAIVAYFSSSVRSAAPVTKSNLYELDSSQVEKRQVLPDYVFKDADAKSYKLSDFHGQVLIVSFWASWCSPCLVELPTFSQMQKKLKNQGLRILAVNVEDGDDGKKFASDFWGRNKFDFLSLFDTTKELAESFQVDLLPSNFVIDKSGRLAFSGFGATDWSSPQIAELIDGLLLEAPQEIANRPAALVKPPSVKPPSVQLDKSRQDNRESEAAEEDVD